MMAQAPDPLAVERAKAEAQRHRHEAATAPSRRPDPERIVQRRPTRATAASPHLQARRPARSRAGTVVAVAGSLVVAAAAAWYFVLGPGRGGSVAVTVTTEPAGAQVFDGERLLGNAPLVVKLPRGDEPHTLSVRKDGYLAAMRVVTAKQDQPLKLRLSPKPVEEKEEAPPPTVTPPPAPAPVATRTATRTPAKAPRPSPPEPPRTAVKASPVVRPAKPHHGRPQKKEDTLILTPSF